MNIFVYGLNVKDMNNIDWQNGDVLYEGNYLVTVIRPSSGETFVTTDYYELCDGWQNYGEGTPYKVIAYFPVAEIEPYREHKFKIGEIVVENGIIGTITKINNDGTYLVVGAALMRMDFTPSICRLATPKEALSLGAKWRERGVYYDIKTNEIKKL